MANLAFLGLGAMGAPMATRLIDAGHEVVVWNRTRGRAEAMRGAARIAATPADAVAGVDAAVTMLATPEALEEVLFGDDGAAAALAPGTTLLEMSTIGPDRLERVRARLPAGVELVDVPVLGGTADARGGTLQLYFGATDAQAVRWGEVLAPLGEPRHLGGPGAGAAMKLVANSTLAGLQALIGEALALADGFGIAQETSLAALRASPIGPALERKLDKIEADRYEASFRLALMLKDMRLVMDAAAARGVDIHVAQAATRWLAQAGDHGLGDCDYSAVIAEIRGRDAGC